MRFVIAFNQNLNSHTKTIIKYRKDFPACDATTPKPQSPTEHEVEIDDMIIQDVSNVRFIIAFNENLKTWPLGNTGVS